MVVYNMFTVEYSLETVQSGPYSQDFQRGVDAADTRKSTRLSPSAQVTLKIGTRRRGNGRKAHHILIQQTANILLQSSNVMRSECPSFFSFWICHIQHYYLQQHVSFNAHISSQNGCLQSFFGGYTHQQRSDTSITMCVNYT